MYEFQAGEGVESGIKRILVFKVEETIGLLEFHGDDPAISIHEARKNFKRLRAALRLVRKEIGPQHFNRENVFFRDLSRRLAPLRDSEVMLETFDLLEQGGYFREGPDGMVDLRNRLESHKLKVHAEFFGPGAGFEEIAAALGHSLPRLRDLPIEDRGFHTMAAGFRRVYRRGRRRMVQAYLDGEDPHKFHEWRKRVKYLWHHYEILRPLEPNLLGERIDGLQTLSGLLGEAHDAAFLVAYLTDGIGIPMSKASNFVIDQANHHHAVLVGNAYSWGEKLYGPKPKTVVEEMSALWDAWAG